MKTKIFLPLIAILFISISGCERIRQIVAPDVSAPEPISTIKVGVIQPSGLAPNFTRGAELARTQVNDAGGLLGIPVEFIVMDNQGDREFPDPDESVRIAKALIQEEGVVAILGPLLSTNSMQVGPVVTELQRPIITGSSGEKVTLTGEFVFITVVPSSIQGATTAQIRIRSHRTQRQNCRNNPVRLEMSIPVPLLMLLKRIFKRSGANSLQVKSTNTVIGISRHSWKKLKPRPWRSS